jgi:hypothetical protein
MRARLGEAIYVAASALALIYVIGAICANVLYIGGGLLPDLGALFVGSAIWLFGRIAKALLTVGA